MVLAVTQVSIDVFLVFMAMIVILMSFLLALMRKLERRYPDPVRKCAVYRRFGCSHVDGLMCDMRTCQMKAGVDILEIESRMEIPVCNRTPYHTMVMLCGKNLFREAAGPEVYEQYRASYGREKKEASP